MNKNTNPQKNQLRKQLRQQRRRLSTIKQRQAAAQLCRVIRQQPDYIRAKSVAFYWPNDGEISPLPLLKLALMQAKHCYLPVITPTNTLYFCKIKSLNDVTPNRFGIPEPMKGKPCKTIRQLDIIFMPLVGFDNSGNRLGMGGGFYDRSLAFKKRWPGLFTVKLIGLAHSFQQLKQLPNNDWDIPLNSIVTEKFIYRCTTTC